MLPASDVGSSIDVLYLLIVREPTDPEWLRKANAIAGKPSSITCQPPRSWQDAQHPTHQPELGDKREEKSSKRDRQTQTKEASLGTGSKAPPRTARDRVKALAGHEQFMPTWVLARALPAIAAVDPIRAFPLFSSASPERAMPGFRSVPSRLGRRRKALKQCGFVADPCHTRPLSDVTSRVSLFNARTWQRLGYVWAPLSVATVRRGRVVVTGNKRLVGTLPPSTMLLRSSMQVRLVLTFLTPSPFLSLATAA